MVMVAARPVSQSSIPSGPAWPRPPACASPAAAPSVGLVLGRVLAHAAEGRCRCRLHMSAGAPGAALQSLPPVRPSLCARRWPAERACHRPAHVLAPGPRPQAPAMQWQTRSRLAWLGRRLRPRHRRGVSCAAAGGPLGRHQPAEAAPTTGGRDAMTASALTVGRGDASALVGGSKVRAPGMQEAAALPTPSPLPSPPPLLQPGSTQD